MRGVTWMTELRFPGAVAPTMWAGRRDLVDSIASARSTDFVDPNILLSIF